MRWLVASIYLCVSLATGWSATTVSASTGDTFCSVPPTSYEPAKQAHPDYKDALTALEKRGIATWFSDRTVNNEHIETTKKLVATCPESSRLSIVVYGLPNKDCEAGYSANNSSVQTAEDYADFIDSLAAIIGERKVLYVLEPDAIGLISNGGCGLTSQYQENMIVAITKLTEANANAEVYVDVGFWTLNEETKATQVADIVRELAKAGNGRVKGITLNTSNYRPTKEIAGLCTKFQSAYKSTDLHCIIDTSRNYNQTISEEWCNRRTGGIGHPPTGDTGIDNIDYFVWIKPPGESDGECDKDHTPDAMVGPEAGKFFPEQFELLWNNGYLHLVDKMAGINLPASSGGGAATSTVIVIMCVIAIVAIAFIAFMVYRRRKTKTFEMHHSRAYFA